MTVLDQIFNEVITPYLEPRIKKTSIKAVKGYVKAVEGARKVAITTYGLSAAAAILVTGVLMMLIAVIGLLPISPQAAFISIFVMGAILTTVSALFAKGAFSEKAWLEKSKVQEMIDAAVKPWETPYSIPDPRKILAGHSHAASRPGESNGVVPSQTHHLDSSGLV